MGYRVIVAEPFRWHLTGVSNVIAKRYTVTAPLVNREHYLQELHTIVINENVDWVVPVSEEIMHVSFLRDRLPPNVGLYAMPSATLLALHHKLSFIARCGEYGVSAPQSYDLHDPRAATLAAADDYIVKPALSCSGRGVKFLRCGDALPRHESQETMIVQSWVKGDVLSTFSVAHEGRSITTVVYKGAVMSGTVAVCFERVLPRDPQHQPVLDWVHRFVREARFSGFISFDLVIDAQGEAHGIECNPRATSGLHFVDAHELANAVVNPVEQTRIALRPDTLMQQFYPCLTELQKSMFGGGQFRRNLKHFLRARDVTWSPRDPLPFLTMPFTASQIICKSIRQGVTMGEVATLDVGWYEDRSGT